MEKTLRSGFTTGTCAAAAAKAAAFLLCSGRQMEKVHIVTPGGQETDLEICGWERWEKETGMEEERTDFARCSVQKDSGDDPDVTDKSIIWASVERMKSVPQDTWYEDEEFPGVFLTGGKGIGMVTKPGLSCPVGKHAINPVPRNMILREVFQVKKEWEEESPLLVTVEIPEGEELAKKTFNSKLGIVGGLSVLGTTGIVKPMSEEALIASIALEIHMKAVEGCSYLIMAPGNYGEAFLKEHMGISLEDGVKCSNFIADSVKAAAKEGFMRGLLAGHVGKLIKVAGGVENTHSKYGDRRMEILAGCVKEYMEKSFSAENETGKERIQKLILSSNTTEEALAYLEEAGLRLPVGRLVAERVRKQIFTWTKGKLSMDVVIFSSELGVFGKAGEVDRI